MEFVEIDVFVGPDQQKTENGSSSLEKFESLTGVVEMFLGLAPG